MWKTATFTNILNISPHWLNKIYLKIPNIALFLYRLGNGLRTLNTLSQGTGYPSYRVSIHKFPWDDGELLYLAFAVEVLWHENGLAALLLNHFSFGRAKAANQKTKAEIWRILKAPPVNPRVYIYRYYNIDPMEGLKYVRKYVRNALK